ncbi:hypothetical protein ACXRSW_14315 [Aeromonas dhakensis]|uniref:hypothetical protein n=1 Tax=Aeromonas dhakensis TaxID=196024 RepID=UPI0020B38FC5|nr:hypothetical protein [Aeromonas dhakensis]MDD9308771.1 hypothetical protein [Aeromonas hydrophila]WPS55978.1 hypothetical protein RDV79_17265 [Aeromonas dhakensis]WRT73529.1 hypothetical protein VK677_02190 [Aeromonas dhakensis]CAD7489715.1 hypothetical protein KBAD45_04780 [Aeromonas dhakensis]CAD7494445.1 hypothetical protein KBAD59_04810 [Aeromonas dhakensis]
MSHANPIKPNRIQQILRRYFKRILPRPLPLIEDPTSQLNRLMQWDMHQIDDKEYRRRL